MTVLICRWAFACLLDCYNLACSVFNLFGSNCYLELAWGCMFKIEHLKVGFKMHAC